jgi:hypothetical protein
MSNAVRLNIFTLKTRQSWGLPLSEEREVKRGIGVAVRAYAREIRVAFGNDRDVRWVVM